MSFSFFKQFKPKTPAELVKQTRDALSALDDKTVAEVRLLDRALEEVDKNLLGMKQMLLGDGETEPSAELVLQLTLDTSKDDFLELLVQKLPNLGWEGRKDTVQIWCALLRPTVGTSQSVLYYIENHPELLDFLISCYENKEIALNCGSMLRECARYPTLVKYMLSSASFELFFKYVELPSFDIASDAFATFKELLTRHGTHVYEYLNTNYTQFFELYERLLSSSNYVTRRQSLKLLSEFLLERSNAQIMVRFISEKRNLRIVMNLLKVFVANPRKSPGIITVLAKNREKLLHFLDNFHLDKEDEQFEEEKDLLIKEIEALEQVLPADTHKS
ncbi:hypothetical protein O6H91_09G054300 [Diphasiastrum complanatum]|uniref:Uncharacterized protein n=1 Tax=Diphasiastrum complanatum TaxID=34168 RepID=A0ACC2CPD9_DIPCM|nr:hypothetical protein O6H91_09G054300 [Diphasiastrum complanatum]